MPGLSSLLDMIFPPRCVVCQRVGVAVCASCLSSMQPPAAPMYARCGQTIHVTTDSASSLCLDCANGHGPKYLDGVRVAVTYAGAVRPAILALKFRGQRRVAERLAPLMAAPFQADVHTADMIIPVPLHTSRRRERGYNQAELLARALAASQGVDRSYRSVGTRACNRGADPSLASGASAERGWRLCPLLPHCRKERRRAADCAGG